MLSMSASVRSNRSLVSASSRSSEVDGFGATAGSGCTAGSFAGAGSLSIGGRVSLSFMMSGISGQMRQKSSRNPQNQVGPLAAHQLAYDLGGVIDHRDDPRIVQSRRTDHADHPDDAAGAVVIQRDDGRGA